MILFYITNLLLLIFSLLSCRNADVTAEIRRTDSLEQIVTDTRRLLLEIEIAKVKNIAEITDSNFSFLLANCKDSLSRQQAFLLNDYRSIFKTMKDIAGNFEYYNQEIDFSSKQLADMKHDLQNNYITKDDFKKHFAEEMRVVIKMKDEIGLINKRCSEKYAAFDTLHSYVLLMIEQVNNQRNTN